MQNNKLCKTNVLIISVLLIGFLLIGIFSYKANYKDSLDNIEQVTSLSVEDIYYQITALFSEPINTAQTMAHDSFLINHLCSERQHLDDAQYLETMKQYLDTYLKKYNFDSVFLVSTATSRYYNYDGLDHVLSKDHTENSWYYEFLEGNQEYSLNVDNDEIAGVKNKVTVFINCKIIDHTGNVLGIVGIGLRINQLKEVLLHYEKKFGVEAYLIDDQGIIEISTTYNGYKETNWYTINGQQNIQEQVTNWKKDSTNLELLDTPNSKNTNTSFIAIRYVPKLSWHLVVRQDTAFIVQKMRSQRYLSCIAILVVIVIVIVIITNVMKRFNKQITNLVEKRQRGFRKATEELYDNIYELNITKNTYVGKRTKQYFESLGAGGLPYDKGLLVIAKKQIKEEYQDGYVATFTPKNIIREYENGNYHLQYDFMISMDQKRYHWMKIDAYIFYSTEDASIHMFTYRKNIDREKQRERQASTDEMTGLYTKKATERMIQSLLQEETQQVFAFFILDIDNFKTANDQYGHVFGDFCIKQFADILKSHFKSVDILGRVGGDEFVAFFPVMDAYHASRKARELVFALNTTCIKENITWKMSTSIGIAISTRDRHDFATLYSQGDEALYLTKQRGKKGFTIYHIDKSK